MIVSSRGKGRHKSGSFNGTGDGAADATSKRERTGGSRPGNDEIQLDLFGDYQSNVALYPKFQDYFRTKQPPLLAVWGKNDPFFLPAGAEAFKRDNPQAEIHMLGAGHFALESRGPEIAAIIRDFLARRMN